MPIPGGSSWWLTLFQLTLSSEASTVIRVTTSTESEKLLAKKRRAAQDPARPGERCNAAPGTWTPIVDHGRCEAKRDCVVVCPHDVFEIRRIDDNDFKGLSAVTKLRVLAHRRQTAYTPNADACRACGLCVVACPEGAISLVGPDATARSAVQ
jgi:NAD-dependent dihydropyrimidine dehydrogenase PreA subunit